MSNILYQATPTMIRAERYRRDFAKFVQAAWPYLAKDSPRLLWEEPQAAICTVLQATAEGRFGSAFDVNINVPPQSGKTVILTAFEAWLWTRDPHIPMFVGSHTAGFAQEKAIPFRDLIQSDWYQTHFPCPLRTDSDAKQHMVNTIGGYRDCDGVGGSVTGKGYSWEFLDDILDSNDDTNQVAIERANKVAVEDWGFRFKLGSKTKRVSINQRLARGDITDHLRNVATVVGSQTSDAPMFVHLCLPAIATDAPCQIVDAHGQLVYRDPRSPGEPLAPIGRPLSELAVKRASIPSIRWQAQYQQDPQDLTGGLIKLDWLNHTYTTLPFKFERISLIADCANTGLNDPTAILVVGVHQAKLYLIDFVCRPMDFPCLISTITTMRNQYKPTEICIEAASSGHAAIQTLRQSIPNVIDLKPQGSKSERLLAATPMLEAGSVLFPMQGNWLADFRAEVLSFPHARHDESVDVLAYAVNRLLSQGPSPQSILQGYQAAAKRMGLL